MNSEPPRISAPPAGPRSLRRCEIQLQNPCGYPEAGARRLRPWIAPLVGELAPEAGSLAVRFVSDREMRRLNGTYRGRRAATDVLSFPGDLHSAAVGPAGGGPVVTGSRLPSDVHLGDVVISVPAARRQARQLGHSVETELRTLVLHGVLHCMGHDHETDDGTMERLEQRLRLRHIGGE